MSLHFLTFHVSLSYIYVILQLLKFLRVVKIENTYQQYQIWLQHLHRNKLSIDTVLQQVTTHNGIPDILWYVGTVIVSRGTFHLRSHCLCLRVRNILLYQMGNYRLQSHAIEIAVIFKRYSLAHPSNAFLVLSI